MDIVVLSYHICYNIINNHKSCKVNILLFKWLNKSQTNLIKKVKKAVVPRCPLE